jgi:hypothetical protein
MDRGAGVGAFGSACAGGLPTGAGRVHAAGSLHATGAVHTPASFTNSGSSARADAASGGACNPDAVLFAMRVGAAGRG